jgi:hypothetical protein
MSFDRNVCGNIPNEPLAEFHNLLGDLPEAKEKRTKSSQVSENDPSVRFFHTVQVHSVTKLRCLPKSPSQTCPAAPHLATNFFFFGHAHYFFEGRSVL